MNTFWLLLRASTPLFILLFFRFTGTTKAEYEANFKTVSGEVKGPYILVFENFDLVTNDSLRGGDYAFSKFTSLLHDHELYRAYRKFSQEVKRHDMSWNTNPIDSLTQLPTASDWESLKAREEGFVYSRDTVLHSDYRYPIDIPVKLGVYRSVSARVFFSLSDHSDKLQVIFPKAGEEEDPYRLKERVRMSVSGTSSKSYVNLATYFKQLQAFTADHDSLTVKRLNTKAINGRVYHAWDASGELIFKDEDGLEGLEYQTNATGMIDVMSGEGDGRFILWYDHWYLYLLMGIQALLYFGVYTDIMDGRKRDDRAELE